MKAARADIHVSYEKTFAFDREEILRDHMIGGAGVLPACAQVEMIVAACRQAGLDSRLSLQDVAFLKLLEVAPGDTRIANVNLEGDSCRLMSRPPGYSGDSQHTICTFQELGDEPPDYINIREVRSGCDERMKRLDLDRWYANSGIRYGSTLQSILDFQLNTIEGFALMRQEPESLYFVPPAALDTAFQALGLLAAKKDRGKTPFLPYFVREIRVYSRQPRPVWCHARLAEESERDAATCKGHCYLLSRQGEVLVELVGVVLRRRSSTSSAAPQRTPGSIQRVSWKAQPIAQQRTLAPGMWLILADDLGVGSALSDRLRQQGHRCVEVSPGPLYELHTDGRSNIVAKAPEHYHRILSEILDDPRELRGVVHLWTCDGSRHRPSTLTELDRRLETGVFSLLYLVQALAATVAGTCELWVVTMDGQPPESVSAHVSPENAAMWGLARTARLELSRFMVRLVNLASASSSTETLVSLLHDEMTAKTTEFEVAFPAGERQVPRLVPVELRDPGELQLKKNGVYMIVGGQGGLGLELARAFAHAGVAALVLVNRSPLDDSRNEGTDLPIRGAESRRQAVEDLRRCGVEVRPVAADVTSLPSMERVVEETIDRLGRLDGIVLCAAVLRDGLLMAQPQEAFSQALRPKAHGAWVLERVTRGLKPDFVVLFSSIAGVFGNVGQGAYAAGNAYLDALAHDVRTRSGKPWMSLDWSLWSEVGMGADHVERAAAAGLTPISPQDGLSLFARCLRHPAPQLVLLGKAEDADRLRGMGAESGAGSRGRGALYDQAANDVQPPQEDDRNRGQTTQDIESHLIATCAKAMGLNDSRLKPSDNLVELGLDSVIAVEIILSLGEALGNRLDPSLLFRYPSVDALVEYIRDQAGKSASASVSDAKTPIPDAGAAILGESTPISEKRKPLLELRATRERPSDACPKFLRERLKQCCEPEYQARERGEYFYEPVICRSSGAWIDTESGSLLNFSSYSYLDLIGHPAITDAAKRAVDELGTGTHGVRLLAGTTRLHRDLEKAIARFKGTEDAIVYSSGYVANLATISAITERGDCVIGDMYNHASIVDGCRLSDAHFHMFAHGDLADLERCLVKAGDAGKLVVVDAVFSMDGDIIDLPGLIDLCRVYKAALMVDEAHSLGVLGETGRGIEEHFSVRPNEITIKMGTLSKTIPSAGGYVAGSRDLIFALKHSARGFMFSAAITPGQAAAAIAAIQVLEYERDRVRRLQHNVDLYINSLRRIGLNTLNSESPIVPVVCRNEREAVTMAAYCQQRGLFVQPIVHPAVPLDSPRLRTIVTASHSGDDIRRAVEILSEGARSLGLIT